MTWDMLKKLSSMGYSEKECERSAYTCQADLQFHRCEVWNENDFNWCHMVSVYARMWISQQHYRIVCRLCSRPNIKSLRSLAEATWITDFVGLANGHSLMSTRTINENENSVWYVRSTGPDGFAFAHSLVGKLESDVRNQFQVGMRIATDALCAFRRKCNNFGGWHFQNWLRLHVISLWLK